MLWFDVGIKRYTTVRKGLFLSSTLWFDVGIKRYTTEISKHLQQIMLWFDVGIKRYTTYSEFPYISVSCGLM